MYNINLKTGTYQYNKHNKPLQGLDLDVWLFKFLIDIGFAPKGPCSKSVICGNNNLFLMKGTYKFIDRKSDQDYNYFDIEKYIIKLLISWRLLSTYDCCATNFKKLHILENNLFTAPMNKDKKGSIVTWLLNKLDQFDLYEAIEGNPCCKN